MTHSSSPTLVPGAMLAALSLPAGAADVVMPSFADKAFEVFAGLAVVLAVIAAVSWASRRFLRIQPGNEGSLRIVSGVSVGARDRVVLLEAQDTRVLIAVSPGQVRTLHVFEPGAAAPGPASSDAVPAGQGG